VNSEDTTKLLFFLLTFLFIAGWEVLLPRRPLHGQRRSRWYSNLGLGLLNQLVIRVCFPVLLVVLASFSGQQDWGLFNMLESPYLVAVTASFLLFDLLIYAQHRLFHRIDWLWRLHRVHHSDMNIDVTTAVRFHPLEIILSMIIKMCLVVTLGTPPLAVLIFEVALSVTALFNHGNIALPLRLDKLLRLLVVTPDMHRVHHSWLEAETNSNFGFNLTWWDHLFGSYRAQPTQGHQEMTVGLKEYRKQEALNLPALLRQPFNLD
jgi:sterol desaturase/sphingolipid hydroxylase (fatty acid hydroxylase superfamily)